MERVKGVASMVVGDIAVGTQVAVIGAGPGGYVAAIRAAQLGKDVTLIERDPNGLGGICLNHGCIPSKSLIYAVNQYHQIHRFASMGITCDNPRIDMPKLQEWKDKNLTELRNGIATLMNKYGVTVVFGEATFESSRKLKVVGRESTGYIEFERAIIATGSRPRAIEGFEVDGKQIITSREVLQLREVPRSTIVVGGGFIGLELSGMLAKLGSKVTLVEKFGLVPNVDSDLLAVVRLRLEKLGVQVYENATPERLKREGNKIFMVVQTKENGPLMVEGEKVLMAVGVQPNLDRLGLEKTQVQLDERGFVKVSPSRRTTDPHIYAIGDVTGHPMLAHKASREAKIAAESVAGLPSAFDTNIIPWVIFSDPEIATVGLGEDEARQKGHVIRVGRFPFNALGRAVSVSKSDGFVKIIAEKESGVVLGAHIVGPHASDMISEAALGMEMGMRLEDLAATIHPHPTFPEALIESAEAALGRAINIWQPRESEGS